MTNIFLDTNVVPDFILKKKCFEDAWQNFCAEEEGYKLIITRNTKDYKKSTLSIQTPKEFLASFTLREGE